MKKFAAFGLLALSYIYSPAGFGQTPLTSDEINAAEFVDAMPEGVSALTVKLQVLLDRAGANPGVVDGVAGENVTRAIRGFEEINGLEVDGIMTPDLWERLRSPEPVSVTYTITALDLEKIVAGIPTDYAEMAKMEWLGFTSGAEALAEKFHMDQNFLISLNPFARFIIGENIVVINPGEQAAVVVTRIVADKSNERIVIYGENDQPVIVYPATIGSDSTPSPKGTHEVNGIAVFPTYAYNPDVNFQQAENTEKLTIPPGPNGPVGGTWIDLSEPTYGIHGTPDPSKISKTASHGCVRLTNWDAAELAKLVKPGVVVTFIEAAKSIY
ncbi:MAG: murein L,D-transpeptidase [Verrucomicrobia bacterium]|nr:murein L,D-transpeptidase [Deltaproteobacteria bacterium]